MPLQSSGPSNRAEKTPMPSQPQGATRRASACDGRAGEHALLLDGTDRHTEVIAAGLAALEPLAAPLEARGRILHLLACLARGDAAESRGHLGLPGFLLHRRLTRTPLAEPDRAECRRRHSSCVPPSHSKTESKDQNNEECKRRATHGCKCSEGKRGRARGERGRRELRKLRKRPAFAQPSQLLRPASKATAGRGN